MPNRIEIYKPGKILLGADLESLMSLSLLSSQKFKFFLGKPPHYQDFLSSHRRHPIKTPVLSILVRYLFKNLDEFPRAELSPPISPFDIREFIHGQLHNPDCPYQKRLSATQFAGLFGMSRTWANTQVARDTHGELLGPPETMMRAATVMMHGLRVKGMIALDEWRLIVKEEAQLRDQPDALEQGWVATKNRKWYQQACDKIDNTQKTKRMTIVTKD